MAEGYHGLFYMSYRSLLSNNLLSYLVTSFAAASAHGSR